MFKSAVNRVSRRIVWTVGTQVQPFENGTKDPAPVLTTFTSTKFEGAGNEAIAEKASESLRALWPFLYFARTIGMCSIARKGNELVVPRRNPYWIFTAVALFIQLTMVLNVLQHILEKRKEGNEKEESRLVLQLNYAIYYIHALANCVFMIFRVNKLPHFLSACGKIELMLKKYKKDDDRLVKHVIVTFTIMISAQLLSNVLSFYSTVEKGNITSIGMFVESFDYEFSGEWGSGYSGIFFAFAEVFCDLGWTFGDVMLALLSIILSRFFIRLNKIIKERGKLKTEYLEEVRSDHREISRLVELCNQIFSPLFLLNYFGNIAYLLTRLYTGLSEDLKAPKFWVKVESIYAFGYQIMKIMFPTWLAAGLNEKAKKEKKNYETIPKANSALDLVHSWPSYETEAGSDNFRILVIGRFVSQLVNNPVGISGCGYFLITKSFLVTLVSAVVTYEVVILQFQQSGIK